MFIILIAAVAGFCSFVFALLFSASLKIKNPLIIKLTKKPPFLFIAAVFFAAVVTITGFWDRLTFLNQSSSVPKPIISFFYNNAEGTSAEEIKKELKDDILERTKKANEAQTYFEAAVYDFSNLRFNDAVKNQEKSIEAYPTISSYLNLSLYLINLRNIPEAEKAIDIGLKMAYKKQDKDFEARFLINRGNVYIFQRKFNEALGLYNNVIALSGTIKKIDYQASAHGNMAFIYLMLGKYDEAQKSSQKAIELNEKVKNPIVDANAKNIMGVIYRNRNDLDKALEYFKEALIASEESNYISGRAFIINNMGLVYDDQGNRAEAMKSFKTALKIAEKYNLAVWKAMAYGNIGSMYYEEDQWKKALETFQKELDICTSIEDYPNQASALFNMATVYEGIWDLFSPFPKDVIPQFPDKWKEQLPEEIVRDPSSYSRLIDKALGYYQQALESSNKARNPYWQGMSLLRIGQVYIKKGKLSEAFNYYQKAFKVIIQIEIPKEIPNKYVVAAEYFYNAGKLDEALECYRMVYKLFKKDGNLFGQAEAYRHLGRIYYEQKNLNVALENYQNGYSIFKKINNTDGQAQTLQGIGNVYVGRGNWSDALHYYEMAIVVLNDAEKKLINIKSSDDRKKNEIYEITKQKALLTYNVGVVYYNQKKFAEALQAFQSAHDKLKETKNNLEQADCLFYIGIIYMSQENSLKALEALERARLIYEGIDKVKFKKVDELIKQLKPATSK